MSLTSIFIPMVAVASALACRPFSNSNLAETAPGSTFTVSMAIANGKLQLATSGVPQANLAAMRLDELQLINGANQAVAVAKANTPITVVPTFRVRVAAGDYMACGVESVAVGASGSGNCRDLKSACEYEASLTNNASDTNQFGTLGKFVEGAGSGSYCQCSDGTKVTSQQFFANFTANNYRVCFADPKQAGSGGTVPELFKKTCTDAGGKLTAAGDVCSCDEGTGRVLSLRDFMDSQGQIKTGALYEQCKGELPAGMTSTTTAVPQEFTTACTTTNKGTVVNGTAGTACQCGAPVRDIRLADVLTAFGAVNTFKLQEGCNSANVPPTKEPTVTPPGDGTTPPTDGGTESDRVATFIATCDQINAPTLNQHYEEVGLHFCNCPNSTTVDLQNLSATADVATSLKSACGL